MTTYNILFAVDGGGFQHTQVVGDLNPDQYDLAADLVARQLAAQGRPDVGQIRIHRITPA